MAINWFEGGRRISNLCIVIVIAIGVVTIFWRDDPDPVLSIGGPTMPWFVSEDSCPEDAYVRHLLDYEWGGEKPGLRLCFLTINGKIPYAIAPTPPEVLEREAQADQENHRRNAKENERRVEKGEQPLVPVPPMKSPWFYTASEYDETVQAYVSESIANLRITPKLATELNDSISSVRWNERKKAFSQASPWVFGIWAFIMAFTYAVGWIVRGFAGIPTGHDFKPTKTR